MRQRAARNVPIIFANWASQANSTSIRTASFRPLVGETTGLAAPIWVRAKTNPEVGRINCSTLLKKRHSAGVGRGFKCGDPNSRAALGTMVATHVSIFYCPTRRAAQPYPWVNQSNKNFDPPPLAGKTDYAGNMGGDFANLGMGTDVGPDSLAKAENLQLDLFRPRFSGQIQGALSTV